MRIVFRGLFVMLALLAARAMPAQQPTAPSPADARPRADTTPADAPRIGPPIRRISTASAVSTEVFENIQDVVVLPGDRILLNDAGRRQLLLLDTTLAIARVVLDSASDDEDTYGTRGGALMSYRGDSALFIDPTSLAMIIIDPGGAVARVRSVPRVRDVNAYTHRGSRGRTAIDAKGRIVYWQRAEPARPAQRPPRGVPFIPVEPDSAFIVAIDIDSREIDTLGSIRIPKSDYTVRIRPGGGWDINEATNPLPLTDDWAVLADGSVAFLRGIDYRVDYLDPDGSWTSSPKLPYDWQRLTEEDKRRIVDSLRTVQTQRARTQYTTQMIRWVNLYGKGKYPEGFAAPQGYRLQQGLSRDWVLPAGASFPASYIYACAPGEEPKMLTPDSAQAATSNDDDDDVRRGPPSRGRPSCIPAPIPNTANVPQPPRMRDPGVIDAEELPDFRPPFTQGAVRADAEGNLWIRAIQPRPVPGGPVYDIVSREGQLVDRIQLPTGYQIVGFGTGKTVFLSVRDQRAGGVKLARVLLR